MAKAALKNTAQKPSVHEEKRVKNYTLLAIMLGLVALVFVVSMIRMAS